MFTLNMKKTHKKKFWGQPKTCPAVYLQHNSKLTGSAAVQCFALNDVKVLRAPSHQNFKRLSGVTAVKCVSHNVN